jgi:CarD family transcriptional regulator
VTLTRSWFGSVRPMVVTRPACGFRAASCAGASAVDSGVDEELYEGDVRMKATQAKAKPAAAKAAPAKAAPVKVAPAKAATAKVTPAKAVVTKTATDKPAKPKQAPVKTTEAKTIEVKTAPVKTAAKPAPSKTAPAIVAAAKPAEAKAQKAVAKAIPSKAIAAKPEAAKPAQPVAAAPAPAAAAPAPAPAPQPAAAPAPAAARPGAHRPAAPAPAGSSEPAPSFTVGDHVVYPTHGVGRVTGVVNEEIAGHKLTLIVIEFEENRMVLRVPVAKARTAGLRKLSTRKAIDTALATLKGRARVKRTMWSRRAQEYEAKINSGDPVAIAEVVRDLHRNAGQPDQSFSERQIYEQAMDRLAAELAAIDGIDKPAAQAKLATVLKAA